MSWTVVNIDNFVKKDDNDKNSQNDSDDGLTSEDVKEVKADDDNDKEDVEGNFVNKDDNDKNSQNDSDDGWNWIIKQWKKDEQEESRKKLFEGIEKQEQIERALKASKEIEEFCQLMKEEEDRRSHFYNELNEIERQILESDEIKVQAEKTTERKIGQKIKRSSDQTKDEQEESHKKLFEGIDAIEKQEQVENELNENKEIEKLRQLIKDRKSHYDNELNEIGRQILKLDGIKVQDEKNNRKKNWPKNQAEF